MGKLEETPLSQLELWVRLFIISKSTFFLDVISIEKSNENFRVLYDTQGKFILKTLKPEEAKVSLPH